MNTGDIKDEGFYYTLIIYYIFFIPLCWILFFINILVQYNNSQKRKK